MASQRASVSSPASKTNSPKRFGNVEVHWREHTEEREKTRATTSVDIMTYYLENCHKPKPVHSPGFKKLKDRASMIAPEPSYKDIFPKYPLPVNFINMQQHHILKHPPVRRPPNRSAAGAAEAVIVAADLDVSAAPAHKVQLPAAAGLQIEEQIDERASPVPQLIPDLTADLVPDVAVDVVPDMVPDVALEMLPDVMAEIAAEPAAVAQGEAGQPSEVPDVVESQAATAEDASDEPVLELIATEIHDRDGDTEVPTLVPEPDPATADHGADADDDHGADADGAADNVPPPADELADAPIDVHADAGDGGHEVAPEPEAGEDEIVEEELEPGVST